MYKLPARSIGMASILALTVLAACERGPVDEKAQKKADKQEAKYERKLAKREGSNAPGLTADANANSDISRFAAAGCDDALWNRVYNPTRLQKLSPCIAATGIVSESQVDPDGDQHFLLTLDPGQEALIDKRNVKKKNGALVVEIVCANPTTLPKVKSTCVGYKNPIAVPQNGQHLRATGSYVIDTHNGWAEIHPVSKLERI